MPLHLASVTRAPTLQHISDRMNLISAQHNLGTPQRTVASLMMYAFEVSIHFKPSQKIDAYYLFIGQAKAAYHAGPFPDI